MARRPNTTPPYRLHKRSGRGIATFAGRQIYFVGEHDSPESRAHYHRCCIAFASHGEVPEHIAKDRPEQRSTRTGERVTVAAMLGRFWQHVEAEGLWMKDGKKTSEHSCMAVALRPLLDLFGHIDANEFGPDDLREVRRALCLPMPKEGHTPGKGRRHEGPRARQSVNKHCNRIRQVFKWALSKRLIEPATLEYLRAVEPLKKNSGNAPVVEGGKVKPANLRDVVKVLREADHVTHNLVRFHFLTGCRPQEAVRLRMSDIDTSGAVWKFTPYRHKNEHRDQTRIVAIGPKAQQLVEEIADDAEGEWLFPGRGGNHISEGAYADRIRKIINRIKCGKWTPGQLRHNTATKARATHGLDTAQHVLGHAHAKTTEIYAEQSWSKAAAFALEHG